MGVVEACKNLEEAGAAVVGLNCFAGPDTMLPLLKQLKAVCKVRYSLTIKMYTFLFSETFSFCILGLVLLYEYDEL